MSIESKRTPSFHRINVPDVDSLGGVYAITQDKLGFLWFGGKNGLLRYDGYQSIFFKNIPGDDTSISSNDISDLFVDSKGRLWVATLSGGGLNQFIYETQSFIRYQVDPSDEQSIGSNDLYALGEDGQGDLWLATHDNGLNRYEHSSGRFYRYPISLPGAENISIRDLAIDRFGNIWAPSGTHGLFQLGINRREYRRYRHDETDQSSLGDDRLYKVFIDQFDNLWVGGRSKGLSRFDRTTNTFQRYLPGEDNSQTVSEGVIWYLGEDSSGDLWVATGSGDMNRYNKWQNEFERFSVDPYSTSALSGVVISMFRDASGDLWVGTFDSQVLRTSERGSEFKVIRHNPIKLNSLSSNTIHSIAQSKDGNLWAGTDTGINRISNDNTVFERIPGSGGESLKVSKNIRSIMVDQDGLVWFNPDLGLKIYDPKTGSYTTPRERYGVDFAGIQVWDMLEDKSGNIWMGTKRHGLIHFNPNTRKKKSYTHSAEDPNSISNSFIWCLLEDSVGRIWVGTAYGLSVLDQDAETFKAFYHAPDDPASLVHNSVRALALDNIGDLWVGTGSGLAKFNSISQKFENYRVKDGLSDDFITAIVVDEVGFVWVANQKGVSRFDPKKNGFRNFDKRHGIAGNAHPRKAAGIRAKDGQIYFGSTTGITQIDPLDSRDNFFTPPVVLTDFLVDNQQISINSEGPFGKHISLAKEVRLEHNRRVFSVGFSALSYMVPEQNQYAYKLVGFDKQWHYVNSNQRLATYTNLKPGRYSFLVKGSNNEGVWSDGARQLNIILEAPWWRSVAAYLVYFLFLVIVLLTIFRVSAQQRALLKLADQRAKNTEKLKQQFLANASQALTMPVNSIVGLTENLLEGNAGELPSKAHRHVLLINENCQKASELIRDIENFSYNQNNMKLNRRLLHLEPIIEGSVLWFQSMAEAKGIKVYSSIDQNLPEVYADYACVQNVLFNLIDNAIHHTDHGYVDVIVTTSATGIVVKVVDTGMGVDVAKVLDLFKRGDGEESMGLPYSKELIELHKGSLVLESNSNKGATFVFNLPFGLT